jgi:hypothetical protein
MEERDHMEELGVDGRIIFKSVLEKEDVKLLIGMD